VEKFPRSHKFTIGDRIEATALDVLESLIEATYTKERNQNLRAAKLGIEIACQLSWTVRRDRRTNRRVRRRCRSAQSVDQAGKGPRRAATNFESQDQAARGIFRRS
jgi:hypothetical protein